MDVSEEERFHKKQVDAGIVEDTPYDLKKAFQFAAISSFVLTGIMVIIIPLPMFFSHYIFSREFFTGWVIVSVIWAFVSTFIACILPVWESREAIALIGSKIYEDAFGGRKGKQTSEES